MRMLRLIVLLGCLVIMGAQTTPPIKIAAIFGLTGEAADSDQDLVKAVHLAVDEINAKGGLLGHQVELLEIDNTSTALGSKDAAERAVKAGVMAVIGADWSAHSLAMAPVLQAAHIPMITPYSTNPDVTLVGDYIFRACFVDSFQGEVMADFARKDLGAKNAVVLSNTSSTYGAGLAGVFKARFTLKGGKILWEGAYVENASDMEDLLQNVKRVNPDIIFLPGYTKDSAYIIKAARKKGIKATFLGGDGWGARMYDYAGTAIDGNYYATHWHPSIPERKSLRFVSKYTQRFGDTKILGVALTYDATMLLSNAVMRAQSLDQARIRDALASTKDFKGVTGTITFDQNRNPVGKSVVIMKFKSGQAVFYKTIQP